MVERPFPILQSIISLLHDIAVPRRSIHETILIDQNFANIFHKYKLKEAVLITG